MKSIPTLLRKLLGGFFQSSVFGKSLFPCAYCRASSGFLRKVCGDCQSMIHAIQKLSPGFGFGELLDCLEESGATPEKMEAFIKADIRGRGSLQDHVTALMTNQVMEGLGQPSKMTAESVRQVRKGVESGISLLDPAQN